MWMGIKANPRPQEFYRDPGFEIHWSATWYKSDVSRYGLERGALAPGTRIKFIFSNLK